MFEGICDAIHREMHELNKKYETGAQLSKQDLEDLNKMSHTLKSIATYEAMKGESGEYSGDSYARGRSRTTGRYVSRDGGYNSYEDGYSGRRY